MHHVSVGGGWRVEGGGLVIDFDPRALEGETEKK